MAEDFKVYGKINCFKSNKCLSIGNIYLFLEGIYMFIFIIREDNMIQCFIAIFVKKK